MSNIEQEGNSQNTFERTLNGKYKLTTLDKETASKYAARLAKLADQIPLVDYTPEQIISEGKKDGSRTFHAKWDHSLILFDDDEPIGFVMGYERESEGNEQYPENTIYISELAVDPEYQKQGLGRALVEEFLEHSSQQGMQELSGPLNFSIQTNSDMELNRHVIELYKSLGFEERAKKDYENRTDVVLGYEPEN